MMQRTRVMAALVACMVAGGTAWADDFYWNNQGGDFTWSNLENWSDDLAGTTPSTVLPGVADVAHWAATTASQSLWLGSGMEVGAVKIFDNSPFPWINGPGAGSDLVLHGVTVDGVANAVVHQANSGVTVNAGQLVLAGGGDKVFYSTSGSEFKVEQGLAETGGAANFIMDGSGNNRVRINTSFNISGDIIIKNGVFRTTEEDLSGSVVTLWGSTLGGNGRMNIQDNTLVYQVGGLVVDGVAFAPGTYGVSALGFSRFETNGGGDADNALVQVIPEPTTIALLLLGLAGIARRRR